MPRLPFKRIGMLVSFLASGFLIFVFIFPLYQGIQNSGKRLAGLAADKESVMKFLEEMEGVSLSLQDYQEDIAKLKEMAGEKEPVTWMFEYLGDLSSSSGLLLREIASRSEQEKAARQPEGEETGSLGQKTPSLAKPGGTVAVIFSLDLIGDYQSIKNFLKAVEKSARIIDVTGLTLNFSEKEQIFSAKVELKTYYK